MAGLWQPPTFPRPPQTLNVAECYRLLRTDDVGRVAFSDRDIPVIVPVNYALDGHHVLLRTDFMSRLARAARLEQIVAFEVDHLDRARHAGWSVVVVGPARVLDEPSELARADAFRLVAWAAGERNLLIRISAGSVTGVRLADDDLDGPQGRDDLDGPQGRDDLDGPHGRDDLDGPQGRDAQH